MVLVSNDPDSRRRGAVKVFKRLQAEIEKFGLADEITLAEVTDIGRHDAIPMVLVYPEAVVYGPVKPEDVPYLVEEHLYKGRIPTIYLPLRAR
jgi:NADP-reducing hydrogenase subunit HndC